MKDFNIKQFLTENRLTQVSQRIPMKIKKNQLRSIIREIVEQEFHNSRNFQEPLPSHIVRQLYTVLSLYDSKKEDPEFGDWTVDPTHVYEHFLEIFNDYDIKFVENFKEFERIVRSENSHRNIIRKTVELLTSHTL